MSVHICSPVVYETLELSCWICLQTCNHGITYTGAICNNCKGRWDEPDYYGQILHRRQREKIGMNRKEWGNALGYAKNSIKAYEFGTAYSKKYNAKVEAFVFEW
jgi:hypothetical protein